jgi:hypothetical protein
VLYHLLAPCKSAREALKPTYTTCAMITFQDKGN